MAPDDGARPQLSHQPERAGRGKRDGQGADLPRDSPTGGERILFTESSEHDKRVSLVSFTQAGLTLFQQLKTEAGSWQHTTDYLPAEARQSIRLHLQSVSDAIEQLHLLDSERPS